jgi:hypothetical protein
VVRDAPALSAPRRGLLIGLVATPVAPPTHARKPPPDRIGRLSAGAEPDPFLDGFREELTDIAPPDGGAPVRVLDNTIHFAVEAFLGAITVAAFQTAAPPNMRRFLRAYLTARGGVDRDAFEHAWERDERALAAALAADPFGVGGVEPGALPDIAAGDPERRDLAGIAPAMLRLFHHMRAPAAAPQGLWTTRGRRLLTTSTTAE